VAKDSDIEWTHHTFNPWWGCVKLSPACAHCYAETWARRFGDELWGGDAPRRFFSGHHWREPLRWNSEADKQGIRARVFCASMADVFEPRTDLDPWRDKLWALIEKTPHLDWLLLTKRPGHIKNVYPWAHNPRENVWLGTTAENQRWATRRIERLIAVDAHVREQAGGKQRLDGLIDLAGIVDVADIELEIRAHRLRLDPGVRRSDLWAELPGHLLEPRCAGGLAVKARAPQAALFTAEPEGFDDHARSFRSGRREKNAALSGTICDALMAQTPGELTFAINRVLVGRGAAVSDQEVAAAVAFAFHELKLVVEPGGAVALAALLSGKIDVQGRIAVAVLSGGNVDPELFHRLVA